MYRKHTHTDIEPRGKKTNINATRKIMSEKRTTLPSLRKQDWRTIISETEKVNDLLTNIPTNDITYLNDLIYGGAKLVCEKTGVPLKTAGRKPKPFWELRLESQTKRLRKQAKTEH